MTKKNSQTYRIIDEKRLNNCLEFIVNEFIKRQAEQPYKPFEVSIKDSKRTKPPNDIQFVWYEIAEQQSDNGWTKEDYRAYCKLNFGIPILFAENEEYRELVEPALANKSYETQLKCMIEPPFKIDVTSVMTKTQMQSYLDKVYYFLTWDMGLKIGERVIL